MVELYQFLKQEKFFKYHCTTIIAALKCIPINATQTVNSFNLINILSFDLLTINHHTQNDSYTSIAVTRETTKLFQNDANV